VIKKVLKIVFDLFIVFLLISCESLSTDNEDSFCDNVTKSNFENLETKIENMLDYFTAMHVQGDEYYQTETLKLTIWLELRICVQGVTARPGILETSPPMKQLYIEFNTSDSTFVKSLFIVLDPNLNVRFSQN